MSRIEITDFEKWGNLVKAWAKSQTTPPKTPKELKDQMARAGVDGRISDEITSIQFIVPDDKTLVILLPPGKAIDDAEVRLGGSGDGAPYPLPAFYKVAFGGSDAKPAHWKTFNAQRLGEYTINNCL
jgi:hypothetical protein